MNSLPSLILLVVFLLHRLDTVSCQVAAVRASVGDAVLLPCIFSELDRLKDNSSVFWRGRGDANVLDIRKNAPDLSTQSSLFKDRVFWDKTLYRKGNFSILMQDVQQADGGTYECHIPSLSFEQRVALTVSDKVGISGGTDEVGVSGGTDKGGLSGGITAVTPISFLLVLLPLLLSLLYM